VFPFHCLCASQSSGCAHRGNHLIELTLCMIKSCRQQHEPVLFAGTA
jgi:hypothetical protein